MHACVEDDSRTQPFTLLRELCQYVQDTSPVRDIIANPVPVETTLQVV